MSKPKIIKAIDDLDYQGFYNKSTYLGDIRTDSTCLDSVLDNGIYTFTGGRRFPTDTAYPGDYKWSLLVKSSQDCTLSIQIAERFIDSDIENCKLPYYRYYSSGTWTEFKQALENLEVRADTDAYIRIDGFNISFNTPDGGGLYFLDEGSPSSPVLAFYGNLSDELVRLNHIANPKNDYDAATKKYVDDNSLGKENQQAIDLLVGYSSIIRLKIVDENGVPVQGITAVGLVDKAGVNQISNQNGMLVGVSEGNTITLTAVGVNYEVDVSAMKGSVDIQTITLPSIDGVIVRYNSSTNVTFPSHVSTVDVCCVGGGGGGSGACGHRGNSNSIENAFHGYGGGGGSIVNSYGIKVNYGTSYPIVIGAGGAGSAPNSFSLPKNSPSSTTNFIAASDGGTTTFLGVSASGGGGGSSTAGTSTNGGDGNSGKSAGTEFDDGSTYYSGGGSSKGTNGSPGSYGAGGSPYGGSGGYIYYKHNNDTGWYDKKAYAGLAGTGAGGGGGGGGGYHSKNHDIYLLSEGGSGASGAVAIRLHS